jgi:hypothetical protein
MASKRRKKRLAERKQRESEGRKGKMLKYIAYWRPPGEDTKSQPHSIEFEAVDDDAAERQMMFRGGVKNLCDFSTLWLAEKLGGNSFRELFATIEPVKPPKAELRRPGIPSTVSYRPAPPRQPARSVATTAVALDPSNVTVKKPWKLYTDTSRCINDGPATKK